MVFLTHLFQKTDLMFLYFTSIIIKRMNVKTLLAVLFSVSAQTLCSGIDWFQGLP